VKLEQIGEFGLIARLKEKVGRWDRRVVVAIGDDAAAVRVSAEEILLLTTDVLVEGVHFSRRIQSFWQIGWRAAVANVSDIAAMGGLPRHAVVSICLPETVSVEQVEELYDGMKAVADEYHLGIIGGDTVSSPRDLVVSLCLVGGVEEGSLVLRGGAQPGDLICTTGDLGGSQAGLAMLQLVVSPRGDAPGPLPESQWSEVRERHLRPRPRLREARLLARGGAVHAMIDVSDGLAGDVRRIAEESGVGVEILEEKIPIGPETHRVAQHLGTSGLDFALGGGEDFELVFTISPEEASGAAERIRRETGTAVSVIGEVLPAREGMVLVSADGKRTPLSKKGYQHF
jgi:thiamine-monophosphate kinase